MAAELINQTLNQSAQIASNSYVAEIKSFLSPTFIKINTWLSSLPGGAKIWTIIICLILSFVVVNFIVKSKSAVVILTLLFGIGIYVVLKTLGF